ncbi:MAG: FAD-dependent oxidoreductase [Candidatus Kapaibacterium sp.]
MSRIESWGRTPQVRHRDVADLQWRDALPDIGVMDATVLPFGNGRSYGDSCLNDGGVLLRTLRMDHLVSIDDEALLVRCESGITFAELLSILVPRGLFVPVTPGTKMLTVGGAIANDVHGKNHHSAGTFGCHVTRFELYRSDGTFTECSATENAGLFAATIGGMGLTGLITWAEFSVVRIPSAFIRQENFRFANIDEYLATSRTHDAAFPYVVSWIDCSVRGKGLGRGIYMGGSFMAVGSGAFDQPVVPTRTLPVDMPSWLLNSMTVRLFNIAFYHKQWKRHSRFRIHYEPFFYPLDAIHGWNKLYGSAGFYQYQCVLPYRTASDALHELLRTTAKSGKASFLAVLKNFGARTSPGMLSFPAEGITLSMDFKNEGTPTLRLMDDLDGIVRSAGGRLYPAKDARMSKEHFIHSYPRWDEFRTWIDPKFSSTFYRRMAD